MQTNIFSDYIRPVVVSLLLFTVIFGVAYPTLSTGIIQALFPHQATGSLITANGKKLGSELIGQNFTDPKYFWGRLSATAPVYNAAASSGSNLGAGNPALLDNAKKRIDALKSVDPDNSKSVPVDLVTASGSGIDPHISPAAAEYQLARVARVRDMPASEVAKLVTRYTEGRQFGILGEPRVNVLKLNLALDGAIGE
jgi:K+-transporting ATPase ATPase C chain